MRSRTYGIPSGLTVLCAAVMLFAATTVGTPWQAAAAEDASLKGSKVVEFRGWGHLVAQLQELGVDAVTLRDIYNDPRMPRFAPIPFSAAPREPHSIYSGFLTPQKLKLAEEFMALHRPTLRRAAQRFGVTPTVVTAILLVESGFGLNTGQELVINRLSRIAGLNTRENIEFNFHRLRPTDPSVTREQLATRAAYLQSTFTPEIVALITLARQLNIDLFEVRGSIAGAFGIPQFLPSSYLRFGMDGNGDGRISLHNPDDAIHSAANFLSAVGWSDTLPMPEKRKVIWRYNKSDAYISAVLQIAERLEPQALLVARNETP